MGHANFEDIARLEGEKAWVRGPIVFGEGDTGALLYAMVCQSIGHDNTVAREVTPVTVTPDKTEWEVEVERCTGEAFTEGMAAATALAIFTNTEGEFSSYSWTDCVHLETAASCGETPTSTHQ